MLFIRVFLFSLFLVFSLCSEPYQFQGVLHGHRAPIKLFSVTYFDEVYFLLSNDEQGNFKLWNLSTLCLNKELAGYQNNSIAGLSPSGYAVIPMKSDEIRSYSLKDLSSYQTMKADDAFLKAFSFHPKTAELCGAVHSYEAARIDSSFVRYNLQTGEALERELITTDSLPENYGCIFSRDGNFLVFYQGTELSIINTRTREFKRQELQTPIFKVRAFEREGAQFLLIQEEHQKLFKILDLALGELANTDYPGPFNRKKWDIDAHSGTLAYVDRGKVVITFPPMELHEPGENACPLFSSGGKYLLIYTPDWLKIFTWGKKNVEQTFSFAEKKLTHIAMSNDEHYLLLGFNNGDIDVYTHNESQSSTPKRRSRTRT